MKIITVNSSYRILSLSSAMYLFFAPISRYFIDDFELINFKNDDLIYISLTLSIFIGIILVPFTKKLRLPNSKFGNYFQSTKRTISSYYSLLLLIALLFVFHILSNSINFSSLFNRSNRDEGLFQTQLWVNIVIFIQTVIFLGIFYYADLHVRQKFQLIILLFLFVFLEIFGLGARRFSLAIFLFLSYRCGLVDKALSSIIGIFVVSSFTFLFLIFGGFRELIFHEIIVDDIFKTILMLSFSNNEFTEIGHGLEKSIDYVSRSGDILYGISYLQSPLILIPREFFPDKPSSLTHLISAPISIYSEAFLNFHILSVFIMFGFFYLFHLIASSGSKSFLSCLIFSFIFDFQRSEFSNIMYQFVFIFLIYIVGTSLIKRNKSFA